MNKWQQQVYDMLRAASRNNLPCTIPADVTHIPANMMLEADKTQWISVKDRLPEDCKKILVVNGHGYISISSLWRKDGSKWTWVDSTGHFNHVNDITHWMPLPEAPKEE